MEFESTRSEGEETPAITDATLMRKCERCPDTSEALSPSSAMFQSDVPPSPCDGRHEDRTGGGGERQQQLLHQQEQRQHLQQQQLLLHQQEQQPHLQQQQQQQQQQQRQTNNDEGTGDAAALLVMLYLLLISALFVGAAILGALVVVEYELVVSVAACAAGISLSVVAAVVASVITGDKKLMKAQSRIKRCVRFFLDVRCFSGSDVMKLDMTYLVFFVIPVSLFLKQLARHVQGRDIEGN
jgi:uncharacterized membrane protein